MGHLYLPMTLIIMAASKTVNELQSLLQEDIDSLVVWMDANKLTLNLLKTKFMIIGSKPKLKDIDETISIAIVGEEIYRSPYVKSLGFIIDQNLDWFWTGNLKVYEKTFTFPDPKKSILHIN